MSRAHGERRHRQLFQELNTPSAAKREGALMAALNAVMLPHEWPMTMQRATLISSRTARSISTHSSRLQSRPTLSLAPWAGMRLSPSDSVRAPTKLRASPIERERGELPQIARQRQRSLGDTVPDLSLRQPCASPADLAPVIDLVFHDVKPSPMRVDPWRHRHGALQPCIVARRERVERRLAHPRQLFQIMLARIATRRVSTMRAGL